MTDTTGSSGHVPTVISRRAVAIGGGVLLTLFAALAVWALQSPPSVETPAPVQTKRAIVPDPSRTTPEQPTPSKAVEPRTPTPESTGPVSLLKTPRELGKLLTQRFQFTRQDGAPAFAQLRSALGPERAVSVLNVWAPYCEPCKREFPAFRRLQEGWGDQVRFMPIQLGEGDPGPLADIMPRAPHHLIDFIPGGAVQLELAALGLLPANAPIPITLVLDCRHQLRWLSAREITDIDGFDRVIAELRKELDTAACARSTPAPSSPQQASACGDGRCDTLGHDEDCLSCPADCGCKPGQLCATQTGGARDKLGHVCMDELQ